MRPDKRTSAVTRAAGLLLGLTLGITCASAQVSITTPSPLPNAVTSTPYSVTLTASGGTAPYTWSGTGSFPPGLQINSTGVLSGTPTQVGSFTISIQVIDSKGVSATGSLSITVVAGGLTITTVSPLFNATVGSPYTQQFTASGGQQPYTWSISAGQIAPLTLTASTGILQGTPTSPGTLNFTVQVTDASKNVATQAFSLTVATPPLVITTAVALPAAAVGISYSQTFSATGGLPPYTWAVANGAVPGLSLDPNSGILSGTPTTAGTYTPGIQVTDSAMTATTRQFQLTVNPQALQITTTSPLPAGTAGTAYTEALTAQGGAPPYTWSAAGLPSGLTISSTTGTISGTSTLAGTFSVTVTVIDSNRATYVNLFSLTMALPPAPTISIGSFPSPGVPASQVPVQVTIPQPYSAGPITGQVSLAFVPAVAGVQDQTIQLSSGGLTASFTIPAGQTTAVFSVPSLAFSTGTVEGTLTLTVQAQAFGVSITPPPAPTQTLTIASIAPVVTGAQLSVSGQNITIQVTGYSTTEQVTQAVFAFSASGNNQLQTATFTVPVGTLFSTWYTSSQAPGFGSQFLYSQTFAVQGDASDVALQSVTLTNSVGSTVFQVQ
jgi:large repetitive protein